MRVLNLALLASLHIAAVCVHAAPREQKAQPVAETYEEVPKKTQKLLKVVCKTAIELDGEIYIPGITQKERAFAPRAKREYPAKIWELDRDKHPTGPAGSHPKSPWEIDEVPAWISLSSGQWYKTKADVIAKHMQANTATNPGSQISAVTVHEANRGWLMAMHHGLKKMVRVDVPDTKAFRRGESYALFLQRGGSTHRHKSYRLVTYKAVDAEGIADLNDLPAPDPDVLFQAMDKSNGVLIFQRYKPQITPSVEPRWEMTREQRGHIVSMVKGRLQAKGRITFGWEKHRPLRFDFRVRKTKAK